MIASNNLKKQIIIEIIALLFLVAVIIYAAYAIHKNNQNYVNNQDGFVTVLDDSKLELKALSDGEGLSSEGLTYAVTNNNEFATNYQVIIKPNANNEEIIKQIRVSVDDLYVENLHELETKDNGYIIITHKLNSGYTKNHNIKLWYKLGTKDNILKEKIDFEVLLSTN